MNNFKIHIVFDFKELAYGGGNQFLKALKKQLVKMNCYTENPKEAKAIIFNSYQKLGKVIFYKLFYPDKIFIHRIDGPISKYRETDAFVDKKIYAVNKLIAQGTIFQSEWSRKENYRLGYSKKQFETVIGNACDPDVFNADNKIPFSKKRKIKLVAVSWSPNWNKGFDVYNFLDKNLDFSKYEIVFIGNAPLKFRDIKIINPVTSLELAKILKQQDIYITASKNDPCSNSLIEALSCGLPVIAISSGGHPEIIDKSGELFKKKEDIPEILDKIINDYPKYTQNIRVPELGQIASAYLSFIRKIIAEQKK